MSLYYYKSSKLKQKYCSNDLIKERADYMKNGGLVHVCPPRKAKGVPILSMKTKRSKRSFGARSNPF